MHATLRSLRLAIAIGTILAVVNSAHAAPVRLSTIFVFSSDTAGSPAGDFVWDTRGLDSDFYKVFLSDGLAGPFLSGPTWAEAPIDIKLKQGENHFTLWFQANGPWDHFAMNLFFDDHTLPAICVKAPLTATEVIPPFSANSAPLTFTMTSYPQADGPASGSLSAELGKRVELTQFAVVDPALLNLDRVGTHNVGANGVIDFAGTFTLVVGRQP